MCESIHFGFSSELSQWEHLDEMPHIFIPHHTIVAGYYDIICHQSIRPSVFLVLDVNLSKH